MLPYTRITKVTKLGDKQFEVEVETGKEKKIEKINVNTILMAIGRDPNPSAVGAEVIDLEI
jgi:pyruvate/2-oxoglutarate dehydrogenase complex dihydrolipoamide dehydrogenase (E3) component